MAVLVKFLQAWEGHSQDDGIYLDELQARILIQDGIAEIVHKDAPGIIETESGHMPAVPPNFTELPRNFLTRRGR